MCSIDKGCVGFSQAKVKHPKNWVNLRFNRGNGLLDLAFQFF